MKKLFLILVIPAISLAQGIDFENATFYQLLSKAKSENKIIFIDAYTTWCGPCKYMEKNVFTDTEVGKYFNSNFINVRFNMETGEGLSIAKDYNITAYPTLLFIDGNGDLVHKSIGSKEPKEFVEIGKLVKEPSTLKEPQINNQSIDDVFELISMEDIKSILRNNLLTDEHYLKQIKLFNEGNRDPKFLYELTTKALNNYAENAKTYAREFYKVEKKLLTHANISLMLQTIDSPKSEEFIFLQKNEEEVIKILKNEDVTNTLNEIVTEFALNGIDERESINNKVKKIENSIAKYRPNKAIEISSFYGLGYSEQVKDFKLYEKYALIYFENKYKKSKYTILNKVAWAFYENVTNELSLENALKWAIHSVNLSSNSHNMDTVAHLFYKLGDKNNARNYAVTSIKTGKENGADTTITETLLQKLK